MHDLSPGQEVTVSGMGGGAATVVYTTAIRVRVRMCLTGKERTVTPDRITPKRESKALIVFETTDEVAAAFPDRYQAAVEEYDAAIRRKAASYLRPVPKSVTLTSPAYLAYVRKHPCCLCGATGPSEPHHWSHHGAARGKKADDYRTVPLCQEHHRYWHDHGRLPGMDRVGSEGLFIGHQLWLVESWSQAKLDDGARLDALIRAIGGADA